MYILRVYIYIYIHMYIYIYIYMYRERDTYIHTYLQALHALTTAQALPLHFKASETKTYTILYYAILLYYNLI